MRINKAPFKVIGVLQSKGQSAGGQDQDDIVYIPLSTAQNRMMGITYVQRITVQAEMKTCLLMYRLPANRFYAPVIASKMVIMMILRCVIWQQLWKQ